MSFIPKTRSYRLSFRNKTTKNKNYDSSSRLRRLINKNNLKKYNSLKCEKIVFLENNIVRKNSFFLVRKNSFFDQADIINTLSKPILNNSNNALNLLSKTLTLKDLSIIFQFLKLNHSNTSNHNFLPNDVLSQCYRYFDFKSEFKRFCIITSKAKYISYTEKPNNSLYATTTEDFLSNYANKSLKREIIKKSFVDFNVLRKVNSYALHSVFLKSAKAETAVYSSHFDKIRFGSCGIYFQEGGTLSSKSLITARLAVSRILKKNGRFWIRICADTPVTSRSAETRMGRGKGAISHYEAKITSGMVFMEFSGVKIDTLATIFKELTKKTHLRIKYVN